MKNIFITGGAGYIGSHCVLSLIKHGYEPIILDNFSNSSKITIKKLEKIAKKKIIFYDVDLKNKKKLKTIFERHNCYCVIHCAGFKAVEESTKKPLKYLNNNIGSTLGLIECMQEKNKFNLIFSSSAVVYDEKNVPPFDEKDQIGESKNPYATTKIIIEKILMDLVKFDKRWKIGILRYFNPIGNHSSGIISDNPSVKPNNLLPYIVKVAKNKLPYLKVFGNDYPTKDGTCLRDYIHVMDLAEGHVALIKKKLKKSINIYNLGTGNGLSVLEIIQKFEKQNNIKIPFKFSKRREGDIAISFCNPKKAFTELNWRPKYSINQAMKDIKSAF
jgi:UDP-glucose 4-epimerase